MRCEHVRVGLSARLDGEHPGLPDEQLDAHARACPACAAWLEGAAAVSRRLRVRPAEPVADLAPAVVAALRDADLGLPSRRWSRLMLALIALVHLLLSLPGLLFGDDGQAGLHVAREVGATDAALAVGVLCAAWRPWRAAGMLPVVAVLALGLAATSVVDVLAGDVPAVHELPHLLALVEVVFLWRLRHGGRPRQPTPSPSTPLRRVA